MLEPWQWKTFCDAIRDAHFIQEEEPEIALWGPVAAMQCDHLQQPIQVYLRGVARDSWGRHSELLLVLDLVRVRRRNDLLVRGVAKADAEALIAQLKLKERPFPALFEGSLVEPFAENP